MSGEVKPEALIADLKIWWNETFMSQGSVTQLIASVCLLIISALLAREVKKRLQHIGEVEGRKSWIYGLLMILDRLMFPLIAVLILGTYMIVSASLAWPYELVNIFTSLLAVWFFISLATSLLEEGFLVKCIKLFIWLAFAFNVMGLLEPVVAFLESVNFSFGATSVTLYDILKGVAVFVILLRITLTLSKYVEKRIHKANNLTSSHKVLFSKFTRILLFLLTVLIPINAMGVDLTILTVFSGALGVGIGFGLQKIVSNFISGIILLMDRSIKPGDVIVVGETYGWVNSLSARYASIITRDGKEHLIPNELLITEKVENWSFSNQNLRVRIPIGVSYDSDIHLVKKLILEATENNERILTDPEPRCLLRAFGESSVDFELRIWITDPANGMGNIQSEVLFRIWDLFKEHKIEIPYPQRDIHIKSSDAGVQISD